MLHEIVLHEINPNTCNTNRTYELPMLSYRGAERERLGKVRKLNPGHCSNDCSSPFLLLDEDECANANGGCSQRCDNFPGNFRCSCAFGYTLQPDKKACQGKNCSFFKFSTRSNFLSMLEEALHSSGGFFCVRYPDLFYLQNYLPNNLSLLCKRDGDLFILISVSFHPRCKSLMSSSLLKMVLFLDNLCFV